MRKLQAIFRMRQLSQERCLGETRGATCAALDVDAMGADGAS